jgi:hypothetical protein
MGLRPGPLRVGDTLYPVVNRELLAQAVAEVQAIADPRQRLDEANRLDSALASARNEVAKIRRHTVNSMRSPATGYGRIAQMLGLSKARVQQIAREPGQPVLAAYAIRGESGQWYGEPGLLPAARYRQAPSFIPFTPADEDLPLAGQVLTVRYGEVAEEGKVSYYTVQIRRDDGSPLNLRMSYPVQDALFGPPYLGSIERQRWKTAREQRAAATANPLAATRAGGRPEAW